MGIDVSIVIPCFNEEMYIGHCIDSLLKETDGLHLEIIIADGMSTDKTRTEIAKKKALYPGQILLLDNRKRKTPYALNLGIAHAQGEYTLIASAHSSFDSNYIKDIIRVFRDEKYKADIIGGMMETKVLTETAKSLSIVKVLSNKFGVGNSMFRVGVEKPTYVDTVPFGIYRTELLKMINGYDVRLIRNHDMEMSKRIIGLGYKILLLPTPKCYYYARETFSGLFRNNFRNGNWNIKTVYITRRFSSLSVRHFIPLIFLLSLILPVLAEFIIPGISILALISFIFYSLVILSQSIKINRSDSRTSIGYSIIAFVILHISYGLGSLMGLFSLKYLRV